MNLIIKKGNFDRERIHIKKSGKCNKILYNLDYVISYCISTLFMYSFSKITLLLLDSFI